MIINVDRDQFGIRSPPSPPRSEAPWRARGRGLRWWQGAYSGWIGLTWWFSATVPLPDMPSSRISRHCRRRPGSLAGRVRPYRVPAGRSSVCNDSVGRRDLVAGQPDGIEHSTKFSPVCWLRSISPASQDATSTAGSLPRSMNSMASRCASPPHQVPFVRRTKRGAPADLVGLKARTGPSRWDWRQGCGQCRHSSDGRSARGKSAMFGITAISGTDRFNCTVRSSTPDDGPIAGLAPSPRRSAHQSARPSNCPRPWCRTSG